MKNLTNHGRDLINGLIVLFILSVLCVALAYPVYQLYLKIGWFVLGLIPILVVAFFIGKRVKLIQNLKDSNVKVL